MLLASLARLFALTEVGLFLVDDRGRLRSAGATSKVMLHCEEVELQHGEGPCVDTARTGRSVLHQDVVEAHRLWPAFAPAAESDGFLTVSSLPIRRGTQLIGSANLFHRTNARMTPAALFAATELASAVGPS